MKIVCSACLLGINCKYNGKNNALKALLDLKDDHEIIPVCPEVLGGLSTPRVPSEIKDGKVISQTGKDVTDCFEKGAELALETVKEEQPDLIVLMDRSPSCGCYQIYDGNFDGTLKEGQGVFAGLLRKEGFEPVGSSKFQCCVDDGLALKYE